MMVVALAVIPVYVGQALATGTSAWLTGSLAAARVAIHAAMALDLATRTVLAPRRWRYLASHRLDLVAVAVPPVRSIRELVAVRSLLARPALVRFAGVTAGTIVLCALAVYGAERHHPEGTVDSMSDALWWAIVTASTVGYGDHVPLTAHGRLAATVLMLLGIGVFSVLTAHLAATLRLGTDQASLHDLDRRLARIESLLASIAETSDVPDVLLAPRAEPPAAQR